MLTVRISTSVREQVDAWRRDADRIAFVPTMGNLHDGHLSLMSLARSRVERVVCSIFVNPTQFSSEEDLENYPRTLDQDESALAEQGAVDLLFVPDPKTIYPYGTDSAVAINLPPLGGDLCGALRPGHFDGVASVVLRLLNIVTPDVLVLGDKDYQQRVLMQRLLADLSIPIEVIAGEIYREPDGLAMSSRNGYLSADERAVAPVLNAVLKEVASALRNGTNDYESLERFAGDELVARGFNPDYVSIRRARDLAPPEVFESGDKCIVLAAAWLGKARLIDNVLV